MSFTLSALIGCPMCREWRTIFQDAAHPSPLVVCPHCGEWSATDAWRVMFYGDQAEVKEFAEHLGVGARQRVALAKRRGGRG